MASGGPALRGQELATESFLDRVRTKGRTITIAAEGSEELRYLDWMGANANVGGEDLTHIILRQDARVIEVWEEFLHGTQQKCRLIEELGLSGAERHVKEYMIRHHRLLRISQGDVTILERLLGGL